MDGGRMRQKRQGKLKLKSSDSRPKTVTIPFIKNPSKDGVKRITILKNMI